MSDQSTHVLLETERLILRRFTEADVDHLFALDNDPEVMRYINGGTPTPREVIVTQILPGFMHYDEQRPAFGFWAADDKSTDEFLGWFCFRPKIDRPDEIVLGYRLRKAAWGKGYAIEGAEALIHKGFAELGVQRVVATTYEENMASIRVMEKAGMVFNRAFRLTPTDIASSDTSHTTSDEVWDGNDVEYVLERADWVQ
jgi:RimJ/RimL family protein N-acetyltransferase